MWIVSMLDVFLLTLIMYEQSYHFMISHYGYSFTLLMVSRLEDPKVSR